MKKIVIIGGCAAGPKVAAKAKRVNPKNIIELYTQENLISYSACGLPYFIEGVVKNINQLIIRTPEDFEKKGIKIFLEHKAQKILPKEKIVIINDKEVHYDELVICTGAKPIRPNIKNYEANGVYELRKIEDGIKIKEVMHKSKKAIIIGGGYIGIELLEAFVQNGLSVEVVEANATLMRNLDCEFGDMIKNYIQDEHSQWVNFHFGEIAQEFMVDEQNNFLGVKTKSGLVLEADFCVVCIGVKPNVEILEGTGIKTGAFGGITVDKYLRTSEENIWAAGDCCETQCYLTKRPVYIALGTIANKGGRVVGINASSEEKDWETFDGVLASAITKYFGLTIATTGLTLEAAEKISSRFNLHPISATVVKKDKAGYMPDSENITLKVVADKNTGKILGAQGIGLGDVNKRINAVTSAIQSKSTVEELLHIDLPYAPPYSSTIDVLITALYRLKDQMSEN